MLIFGIITGLTAATLQSSSYICSREFIHRHSNSLLLLVYSQIGMGILGLGCLTFSMPWSIFPLTPRFIYLLLGWLFTATLSQYAFFRTLGEVEASRLSSLLGLKIIILALLYILLFQRSLTLLHWVAICLSALAGLMMNRSGGRLSWRGCSWLFITLLGYSLADICETEMALMVKGPSRLLNSLGITAFTHFILGIFTLPVLFKVKRSWILLRDAAPQAIAWFSAMVFLFACFVSLDVVFGNVLQSTRCVISVIFGIILLKLGHFHHESGVGRKIWFRRLAASLLMLSAVILYSYGTHMQRKAESPMTVEISE